MSTLSAISESNSLFWDVLKSTSDISQKQDDLATKLFANLDTDSDNAISLEESGLDQKSYSSLDANQDGGVSLAELENALELQRSAFLTQVSQAGMESMSLSAENSAEAVDPQELLATLLSGAQLGQAATTASAFTEEVSANGDELVWSLFSESEGTEDSSTASGAGSSENVDDMDLNQDGVVSAEEYAIAMAKRQSVMGGGGLDAGENSAGNTAGSALRNTSTRAGNAYSDIAQPGVAGQSGLKAQSVSMTV